MVGVERMEVLSQPISGAPDGDFSDRQAIATDLGYGASGEIDVNRRINLAAAEGWRGSARGKQGLVDVVVEDLAEAGQVFSTQRARQGFGEASQIVSGWPTPLRSTISTTSSERGSEDSMSARMALPLCPFCAPGRQTSYRDLAAKKL